ncbi:hypothetical protein V6N13_002990 [Hibiscus sabdariffa]
MVAFTVSIIKGYIARERSSPSIICVTPNSFQVLGGKHRSDWDAVFNLLSRSRSSLALLSFVRLRLITANIFSQT